MSEPGRVGNVGLLNGDQVNLILNMQLDKLEHGPLSKNSLLQPNHRQLFSNGVGT